MEILDNTTEECFAGKSRAELITLLENLLEKEPIESLRRTVESIKIAFYKAGIDATAPTATTDSEAEVDAEPTPESETPDGEATEVKIEESEQTNQEVSTAIDPCEKRLKELIHLYRIRRDAYIAEQEQLREFNLRTKLQILEELKELTESDETLDHTFVKFRELQERWRSVGQIPAQNVRDIWERYHLYTENFYGVIKINRELRDLDLKKNLEAKTILCEAAEALLTTTNPIEAFQHLQPLHDQWRETGPVDAEHKEAIWLRFKEASSTINKRHLDFFESLKAEQSNNLARKESLCEKVEAIVASNLTSHKDWGAANDQILEIQREWKNIGFAPKKDNTAIYNRLRAACDAFFSAKREFYSDAKSDMEKNLERKRAL